MRYGSSVAKSRGRIIGFDVSEFISGLDHKFVPAFCAFNLLGRISFETGLARPLTSGRTGARLK